MELLMADSSNGLRICGVLLIDLFIGSRYAFR